MGCLEEMKDEKASTGKKLMEDLLTVGDVAMMLRAREKTIRQWVYQGKIPYLKINGLLRFEVLVIGRWVAEQARGGQC